MNLLDETKIAVNQRISLAKKRIDEAKTTLSRANFAITEASKEIENLEIDLLWLETIKYPVNQR